MLSVILHMLRARFFLLGLGLFLGYRTVVYLGNTVSMRRAFAQPHELLDPPLSHWADGRTDYVLKLRGLPVGLLRVGFLRAQPLMPHTLEFRLGARWADQDLVFHAGFIRSMPNPAQPSPPDSPHVGPWVMRFKDEAGKKEWSSLFKKIFCTQQSDEGCQTNLEFKEGTRERGKPAAARVTLFQKVKKNQKLTVEAIELEAEVLESQESVGALAQQIADSHVPLFLLTQPGEIRENTDLQMVLKVLEQARDAAEEAESHITKEFSEIPYASQRKILNVNRYFSQLLGGARRALTVTQATETPLGNVLLSWQDTLKALFSESNDELPLALQERFVRDALTHPHLRWAWPRTLALAAERIQSEIQQMLNIEQSRKETVTLRIHTNKMLPRSVLRAHIQAKNPQFRVELQTAQNGNGPTPVAVGNGPGTFDPKGLPLGLEFDALLLARNGAVAQVPFSQACAARFGVLTLALNQDPREPVQSQAYQGTWGGVQGEFAFDFLASAAAEPRCQKVILKVQPDATVGLQDRVTRFEKNLLQSETFIQISNGSSKKLRLLPGGYEVTLSSLLTGSIIGKQVLNVSGQTKTKNKVVQLNF